MAEDEIMIYDHQPVLHGHSTHTLSTATSTINSSTVVL